MAHQIMVSIHTPAKGVTASDGDYTGVAIVSIHTPAKGVTLRRISIIWQAHSFNPHTREGCDLLKRKEIMSNKMFQSTHPRRV